MWQVKQDKSGWYAVGRKVGEAWEEKHRFRLWLDAYQLAVLMNAGLIYQSALMRVQRRRGNHI